MSLWTRSESVTVQTKATPILSSDAVYYAVQGGSNFWVCRWKPKVWPFKWKLLSSTSLSLQAGLLVWGIARECLGGGASFTSRGAKILARDTPNKQACLQAILSYWLPVLYFAVLGSSNFWVCIEILHWKLLSSIFLWCCLLFCKEVETLMGFWLYDWGGSNFWVCGWNPEVSPFNWKLLIIINIF